MNVQPEVDEISASVFVVMYGALCRLCTNFKKEESSHRASQFNEWFTFAKSGC